MTDKYRDVNKCLSFLSLYAVSKKAQGIFPEKEDSKIKNAPAINYLLYLHMMGSLNVPVSKKSKKPKLISLSHIRKYYDFLRQHSYIQIKKFPSGSEYIWLTEKGKKIVNKILNDYEKIVTSLSNKYRLKERQREQWQ